MNVLASPSAPAWRRRATALAAATLLAQGSAHALVTFSVTDLSPFSDRPGTQSIATGINDAGFIVGNWLDGSGAATGSWVFAANGTTWNALPPLEPPTQLQFAVKAVAINNQNQILGATLPIPYPQPTRALLWTLDAQGLPKTPSKLTWVPDGRDPRSLNDAGQVLAGNVGDDQAWIYDAQGHVTSVFSLGYYSGALTMNNSGVLGGSFLVGDTGIPDRPRHAFAGFQGGALRDLMPAMPCPPFPCQVNPDNSETRGLNDSGQAVGVVFYGPDHQGIMPFLWSAGSGMVDVNDMRDKGSTAVAQLMSINNQGQIVGQDINGNAVLLTPHGTMKAVLDTRNPFGQAWTWDTPLGVVPSRNLDFVIQPDSFGLPPVQMNNLGQEVGQPVLVRSLSFGTGRIAGGVSFQSTMQEMSVRASGAVTVADNAFVQFNASQIETGSGFFNSGSVTFAGVSIKGRVSNGTFAVLSVGAGGSTDIDGRLDNAGAVGVGPGTLLHSTGAIVNSGSFTIAGGGRVQAQSFTQTAGTLTVDGSLDTYGQDVSITGGELNGNGTINAGVDVNGDASGHFTVGGGPGFAFFRPGHSPGHFSINGSVTLAANGVLELQVERQADGSLAWDQISATQMSFLDGSLVHFFVGNGVAGADVQTLSFLSCTGGCAFAGGVSFVVDGAPGAQLQFGSNGLVLSLPPLQPVPEPATAALLLAGLLLVARRSQRVCTMRQHEPGGTA